MYCTVFTSLAMHGHSTQQCLLNFFDSEALAAVGQGPSNYGADMGEGRGFYQIWWDGNNSIIIQFPF
jgi:hypothetical protein